MTGIATVKRYTYTWGSRPAIVARVGSENCSGIRQDGQQSCAFQENFLHIVYVATTKAAGPIPV